MNMSGCECKPDRARPVRDVFMRLPALLAICALAVSATALRAEKHALLVGINDYQYARDLKGSVNDIEQIREVLLKELGFSENRIETLLDSQATKANILAALARVRATFSQSEKYCLGAWFLSVWERVPRSGG